MKGAVKIVAVVAAAVLLLHTAHAATWTGGGGDNQWSNCANWGLSCPTDQESCYIPSGANIVLDTAFITNGSLVFQGGSASITGNSALSALTCSGGLQVAAGATASVAVSGTGVLTFGDVVNNGAGLTVSAGSGLLTCGSVSGSGGLMVATQTGAINLGNVACLGPVTIAVSGGAAVQLSALNGPPALSLCGSPACSGSTGAGTVMQLAVPATFTIPVVNVHTVGVRHTGHQFTCGALYIANGASVQAAAGANVGVAAGTFTQISGPGTISADGSAPLLLGATIISSGSLTCSSRFGAIDFGYGVSGSGSLVVSTQTGVVSLGALSHSGSLVVAVSGATSVSASAVFGISSLSLCDSTACSGSAGAGSTIAFTIPATFTVPTATIHTCVVTFSGSHFTVGTLTIGNGAQLNAAASANVGVAVAGAFTQNGGVSQISVQGAGTIAIGGATSLQAGNLTCSSAAGSLSLSGAISGSGSLAVATQGGAITLGSCGHTGTLMIAASANAAVNIGGVAGPSSCSFCGSLSCSGSAGTGAVLQVALLAPFTVSAATVHTCTVQHSVHDFVCGSLNLVNGGSVQAAAGTNVGVTISGAASAQGAAAIGAAGTGALSIGGATSISSGSTLSCWSGAGSISLSGAISGSGSLAVASETGAINLGSCGHSGALTIASSGGATVNLASVAGPSSCSFCGSLSCSGSTGAGAVLQFAIPATFTVSTVTVHSCTLQHSARNFACDSLNLVNGGSIQAATDANVDVSVSGTCTHSSGSGSIAVSGTGTIQVASVVVSAGSLSCSSASGAINLGTGASGAGSLTVATQTGSLSLGSCLNSGSLVIAASGNADVSLSAVNGPSSCSFCGSASCSGSIGSGAIISVNIPSTFTVPSATVHTCTVSFSTNHFTCGALNLANNGRLQAQAALNVAVSGTVNAAIGASSVVAARITAGATVVAWGAAHTYECTAAGSTVAVGDVSGAGQLIVAARSNIALSAASCTGAALSLTAAASATTPSITFTLPAAFAPSQWTVATAVNIVNSNPTLAAGLQVASSGVLVIGSCAPCTFQQAQVAAGAVVQIAAGTGAQATFNTGSVIAGAIQNTAASVNLPVRLVGSTVANTGSFTGAGTFSLDLSGSNCNTPSLPASTSVVCSSGTCGLALPTGLRLKALSAAANTAVNFAAAGALTLDTLTANAPCSFSAPGVLALSSPAVVLHGSGANRAIDFVRCSVSSNAAVVVNAAAGLNKIRLTGACGLTVPSLQFRYPSTAGSGTNCPVAISSVDNGGAFLALTTDGALDFGDQVAGQVVIATCLQVDASLVVPDSCSIQPPTNCPAGGPFSSCVSSPCGVLSTCVASVSSYTCICAAGFSGTNCQINIDECVSSPCVNGAACVDGINGYTCNECASSPCENDAVCVDGTDAYTCNCLAGFTGTNCQINIDECMSSPCENGGVCVDGIDGYTCNCLSGFTGVRCQSDGCNPNPCTSAGTCHTGGSCECLPDFSGETCNTFLALGSLLPLPCQGCTRMTLNFGTALSTIADMAAFLANVQADLAARVGIDAARFKIISVDANLLAGDNLAPGFRMVIDCLPPAEGSTGLASKSSAQAVAEILAQLKLSGATVAGVSVAAEDGGSTHSSQNGGAAAQDTSFSGANITRRYTPLVTIGVALVLYVIMAIVGSMRDNREKKEAEQQMGVWNRLAQAPAGQRASVAAPFAGSEEPTTPMRYAFETYHLWYSVLGHPRDDSFNSLERATTLLVLVFVTFVSAAYSYVYLVTPNWLAIACISAAIGLGVSQLVIWPLFSRAGPETVRDAFEADVKQKNGAAASGIICAIFGAERPSSMRLPLWVKWLAFGLSFALVICCAIGTLFLAVSFPENGGPYNYPGAGPSRGADWAWLVTCLLAFAVDILIFRTVLIGIGAALAPRPAPRRQASNKRLPQSLHMAPPPNSDVAVVEMHPREGANAGAAAADRSQVSINIAPPASATASATPAAMGFATEVQPRDATPAGAVIAPPNASATASATPADAMSFATEVQPRDAAPAGAAADRPQVNIHVASPNASAMASAAPADGKGFATVPLDSRA